MENQNNDTVKKLYTQEELDKIKSEYEEKFKELENDFKNKKSLEIKNQDSGELENVRTELEEMKKKYQEKENECLIAKQKEKTLNLLNEVNLSPKALDIVFTPLDEVSTREKIEILKDLIEEALNGAYDNNFNSAIPLTSNKSSAYDAFIEGFDTNRL